MYCSNLTISEDLNAALENQLPKIFTEIRTQTTGTGGKYTTL